nr:MAG TPA_asm: hypothetical protein [Caudoviricetes sp.]DAS69728.1 MAG TPA: hypothetical protein [Caudoviricetes sp.]
MKKNQRLSSLVKDTVAIFYYIVRLILLID